MPIFPKNIPSNLWSLLPPNLARKYQVIPVEEREGSVVLLTANKYNEVEKEGIELALEFSLGRKIVIEQVGDELSQFNEIFNDRYGSVEVGPTISQSMSGHTLVVLFLNTPDSHEEARLEELKKHLVINQPEESLLSFKIVSVSTKEEAVRYAQSLGPTLNTVIITSNFSENLKPLVSELKQMSIAKFVVLVDSEEPEAQAGMLDISNDSVEIVSFGEEFDSIMNAIRNVALVTT